MVTSLLAWSLAFSSFVWNTYAQNETVKDNATTKTQVSNCPKDIGTVLTRSVMNNFDLWRTLQCKKEPKDNTAIIKIVNWVFNIFIFPFILLMIIMKMIKTGDGQWSGGGWYGMWWGGGGWISEWFKNYASSKGTEIALLIIILWIWQLWFLDLFVFFIRTWLKSFWEDAELVIE